MADEPSFPVAIITNHSHPIHGLRLLSFDGGGIRGLSSLLILREVMARVQREEGLNEPPSPWQYFDMITGTSTGGVYVNSLIAIMLGRLRMSVTEAIQCYSLLSERMFSGTKQRWQDGKFKATRLEQFIKEIIKKHSGSEDARMLDDRPDACKVFVCAMSAQNMNALIPTLFRTYRSCQNESPNCMIWEAARATSAAPAFFKRITIADESSLGLEFIDGELGCNNPTARMLAEAKHIYRDRYIATIISIGTGQENTIALPKPGLRQKTLPLDVVGMLKKIATDCEKIAQDMEGRFEANPGVYFRFNVDQGMQSVGLGDWERLSDVAAHTRAYMQLHQNSQRADNAARAMKARNLVVDTATAGR